MLTRNGAGDLVWSRYWLAQIFGGNYYDRKSRRSGWHPNIIRYTFKSIRWWFKYGKRFPGKGK